MVASSSFSRESIDSPSINMSRRYRDGEGNWRPVPFSDNVRLNELGAPSELVFRCENDWHYFVIAAEIQSRGVDLTTESGRNRMRRIMDAILKASGNDVPSGKDATKCTNRERLGFWRRLLSLLSLRSLRRLLVGSRELFARMCPRTRKTEL